MFACMYAHVPHVCFVPIGQKKMPDPLELELQKVVSCHVGAGTQTQTLPKSSCELLSHFSTSTTPPLFGGTELNQQSHLSGYISPCMWECLQFVIDTQPTPL